MKQYNITVALCCRAGQHDVVACAARRAARYHGDVLSGAARAAGARLEARAGVPRRTGCALETQRRHLLLHAAWQEAEIH